MTTVNIGQAKANFSKLIARVAKGEEIVLARAGKPVAKIVAFDAASKRRVPGSARGPRAPSPRRLAPARTGSTA
ncbi:MAG: type II toxin-antitoxin system Phd/YefM family antitoxin [Rhodospirillales bacterium]|nr:type II toxin-antitoxin system Phd/YefM family antitoxin [Rhodospirillales bacterium]